MEFVFKAFSELTTEELYDILALRAEVFVVEQNCVYNDLDGADKTAVHQFLKKDGKMVACARLLKPGMRFPEYSIGRVVVRKSERGTGLGIRLMEEAKTFMIEKWGAKKIKVSAQQYLQRFYENLGFEVVTDVYLEDGIPHLGMIYRHKNIFDKVH